MGRTSVLSSLLAVVLTAGYAAAQPPVYVSNFTGGQVLLVDGTTGTTTVLISRTLINNSTFAPQGMTVGPDARLYICDSLNGQVWRYTPGQPVVPSVNPVIVATFPGGVYPEGPSFSGSDDLYVNTRGFGTAAVGGSGAQGVWVIPGVATPGMPVPITPLQVIPSIGSAGEGTAFAAPGNLLMVDYSGNRVVQSAPTRGPFPQYGPSFAPLITSNLSAPVGITVGPCGDALVSSANTIQRFSTTKDQVTGLLSAQFANTYVTFPRGDVVTFFTRDAANVVWANTNSSTAGGKVWRIAPALNPQGDPISSCTSGVLPASPIVALKTLSQGPNAPLTNAQLQAVGLAIPASNFTAAAKTFSPGVASQTWTFGHYSLRVDYKQVLTTFTQSFTSLMSRPADIAFANPPFAVGTLPMRFPSLGGSVIQFLTPSPPPGCTSFAQCGAPVAGTDFAATDSAGPAFRIFVFFNDPIQGFRNPGLAHSSDDTMTGIYTDDFTRDFWVMQDAGVNGTGNNYGSKYVPFDEPFQPGLALPLSVTLNQPALAGNPLFNLGQNFTVSITVRDANGQTVPGLRIRLSALRFTPTPFVFEVVERTNGAGQQNILSDNGNGKYSIGVETGLFTGGTGTYQFTLFGQGFAPYVFYAQFEK